MVIHRSFREHEFFLKFFLSANEKFELKVSVISQVIKKFIFLSGAKSNNPMHIDYVPKKLQRRPKVNTSKIVTSPYISNDSKMELGRRNDKGTQIFRLFSLFCNLQKLLSLLSFIIYF